MAFDCPSLRILVVLFWLLSWGRAQAADFKVGSSVGIMQQPTSSYYHLVYGGQMDVASQNGKVLARILYSERPEFKSAGFRDKDYGWFAMLGTTLTGGKGGELLALFGGGFMAGYIRTLPDEGEQEKSRHYRLPGPAAGLEYLTSLGSVEIGLGHLAFVGYEDSTQLQSYVAWPFNFFNLTAAYVWN